MDIDLTLVEDLFGSIVCEATTPVKTRDATRPSALSNCLLKRSDMLPDLLLFLASSCNGKRKIKSIVGEMRKRLILAPNVESRKNKTTC